jgi:hypothetical protein
VSTELLAAQAKFSAIPLEVTYPLFTNGTANGTSVSHRVAVGGDYIFNVTGVFGGAAIQLRSRPLGHSVFSDVIGAVLSAIGSISLLVGQGDDIDAVLTGVTGTTSLTATLNNANNYN